MSDRPSPGPKVRKGLYVFYVLCAGLVVLDFLGLRHAENSMDGVYGFYAIYGFIACVVLVVVATAMRCFVMRDEDYYERHEK
jgi:UDP-N-acetylmuramyl pentapeptide phosphotransferase/UDP-N-acetylglucosamine-1-phosphate transferase